MSALPHQSTSLSLGTPGQDNGKVMRIRYRIIQKKVHIAALTFLFIQEVPLRIGDLFYKGDLEYLENLMCSNVICGAM